MLGGFSCLRRLPIWKMSETLVMCQAKGLACGAERYPSYELIARAYLVSKARSDSEQADGMYEYNKAKATAFMEKRGDGYFGCDEVNRRFNNQKIFKSTLYKNGTIKFPDGKVIKPRRAYNSKSGV